MVKYLGNTDIKNRFLLEIIAWSDNCTECLVLTVPFRNLEKAESRMAKLSRALSEVDNKVADLRNRFETLTKEAAVLKIKLDKEKETIEAAELLVSKLDGEYQRWNIQVRIFSDVIMRVQLGIVHR